VDEGSLRKEKVELAVESGPRFGDRRRVAQHTHRSLHLRQIATGYHRRRLVVDADLDACTPILRLKHSCVLLETRAAASTGKYSGTTRVVYYSSTRYFLFSVEISISGCSFLQSIDELLLFTETWGFAISFATKSKSPHEIRG